MIEVPVLVKEALREGSLLKEYNFTVYEADGETVDFVIDNDNLVSESVKFDERMCSDTNLKFGLCEGTSLEFQAFEIPNITGRRIYAVVKVQYKNEQGSLAWYSIPMGWFTVEETSRQASTGIRKISAYNKLKSEYLDEKANALIQEEFSNFEEVYTIDIIDDLLDGYGVDRKITTTEGIEVVLQESSPDTGSVSVQYSALDVYGDLGVLSTGQMRIDAYKAVDKQITNTSYVKTYVAPRQKAVFYKFTNTTLPVRVRFAEDMDGINQSIYDYIYEEFNDNFNLSSSYMNFIKRQRFGYTAFNTSIGDIDHVSVSWFLHVEIVFNNNTVEFYGSFIDTVGISVGDYVNGNRVTRIGTFSDLNKITFVNVDYVAISYPWKLLGGSKVYKNSSWQDAGIGATLDLSSATNTASYYENYNDWYHDYTQYDNPASDPPPVYWSRLKTKTYTMSIRYSDNSLITPDAEKFSVVQVTNMEPGDMIPLTIESLADLTLRDLQSAVFEMNCQYGKLDRTSDLFDGVELNNSRLYPANTLYPADTRYPNGTSERSNPMMYSKLWADEGNVRSFRYLIITYKGTELDEQGNPQEVEKRLQRTVNQNGTDDYNMSDNWIFKNLVWSDSDIGDYADAMVAKMQDITWFPFEMWCAGLPYIETGDELEINMSEGAYTSYVLKRNLKGIQNLQDEMMNGNLDIF